jgi:GAF domain-containing protein
MRLMPDLAAVTRLAATPGWAWVPADQNTQEGEPNPGCQRFFLKRMVARGAEAGLEALMAFEFEWFTARDTDPITPYHEGPSFSANALARSLPLVEDVLNVARVGYWSLLQGHTALVCETLYLLERGSIDTSFKGTRVEAGGCPNYFRALATKEPIVANHVDTCPETRELMDGYLRPLGISSMLDVPVWLNGRLVGVLCEEHVGERGLRYAGFFA